MGPDEEKEARIYEDARHLANIGVWSVELQIRRLKNEEAGDSNFVLRKVSDFHFLVVALTRVRRAAELVNQILDIGNAIDQFDRDVPDLIKMRDVLEHINDYAEGQGRHKNVAIGGLFTSAFDNDTITWSEFNLNLPTALIASQVLFEEIKAKPPASYVKLVAAQSISS